MLLTAEAQVDAIRSDRLILRAPRRTDLIPLHDAIRETLPDLVSWLPWASHDHSRRDTRRYLRSSYVARSRKSSFEFMIEDASDGTLLGVASLHRLDWYRRSAGLGYWLRRSAWGKGLATEAAGALVQHAFHTWSLHRIEAHVAPENRASQRVVEKLGFRREGIARDVEFIDGRHMDHVQYGLLVSDRQDPGL